MRAREKILIADDDKGLHNMLSHALSTHGFYIIHSYDGRETLELAKKQCPDLILLDIIMPFVDGRDVCMELKSDPATRDIKVLMMTGKGDPLDRTLGFEIGADDYIAKPFSSARLSSKIRMVLDRD
jgi:DNA-binding response OmpR family regulator